MLDKVTSKNFKDIVGTKAVLTVMDGPDIELTVEQILEVKLGKGDDRPETCRKKPFSVILSGPEAHQAPDGCYDLSFEKIGVLEQLYVDNKADNPETEDFNTAAAQKVAEAKVAEKKARAKGEKAAEPAAENAASNDASTEQSASVLYEITFG